MKNVFCRTDCGILKITEDAGKVISMRRVSKKAANPTPVPASAKRCIRELNEYFQGKRRHFSVPIQTKGTPFQKKVWQALTRIPHGKTVSYQQIAKVIGSPRAVRAVGSAVGANPLCILIPCHRVIRSDGSLGGYAYGPKMKSHLLRLEAA